MASDQLQNIALGLQGLGAGLQGTLPQFQAIQMQNQQMQAQQQAMQQAAMQKAQEERQKTMFYDADAALKLLDSGNYDAVVSLGIQRLQLLQQFPGANPEDTQRLTKLAIAARNGDSEAEDLLRDELSGTVQLGRSAGILAAPKEAEGFTLGEGQQRFDAQGNLVAENIKETPVEKAEAASPIGKLFQDRQNGLIPPEVFEREVRALGQDPTDAYLQQLEVKKQELGVRQAEQALEASTQAAQTKAAEASQRESLINDELSRAYSLATKLSSSPGLSSATGPLSSRMPTFRAGTADFEADAKELQDLLTLGNLGRMTGVLSESDIKLLANAASGINLGGSEERMREKLGQITTRLKSAMERKGIAVPLDINNMSGDDLVNFLKGS